MGSRGDRAGQKRRARERMLLTVEGRSKLRARARRQYRNKVMRENGYPSGIGHQMRKIARLYQEAAYAIKLHISPPPPRPIKTLEKPKRRVILGSQEERLEARRKWRENEVARKRALRRNDPAYRKYARDLMRARYAKAKAIIDEFKSRGCACGEKRLPCMDIHHVTHGVKRHALDTVSLRGKAWGQERLRRVLAECVPICSNCHRVLHAEERKRGEKISRVREVA